MTKDKTPQAAAAFRLKRLSGQLKKAYQCAGEHVAESLAPIEEAVAEIDEPWLPRHFAEALKTDGPAKAHRPRSCFATEMFANGDKADYLLCVGRKHDRHCGLYVSCCQYNVMPAENPGAGNRPEVAVRESFLVLPEKLPLPLRLKTLDVLDAFAEEYEAHVRKSRGDILERFGQDSPFGRATGAAVAKPDLADDDASEEDETILEETPASDEEEVRDDVPDPIKASAPVEQPVEEKAEEQEPASDGKRALRTVIELEHGEDERPVEKKKETRFHAPPSRRLEEAESKIPLQAWV